MNKSKYIFVCKYQNQEIYYCSATKEFFYIGMSGLNSAKMASMTAFASSIIYVLFKNAEHVGIEFSFRYLFIHMIVGLILAFLYERYINKNVAKCIEGGNAISLEEQNKCKLIVRSIRKNITLGLFSFVAIFFLILIVPVMLEMTRNIIIFASYFILWFALGIVWRYLKIFKKLEAIKVLKSMVV